MAGDGSVKLVTKIGYGAGHILNDMCVSMWFSYLLLFFHDVIRLSNFNTGMIILVGEIAAGISTVLVGALSDQNMTFGFMLAMEKER